MSDERYAQAGAKILPDAKSVFETAEMIVKVKEPQPVEIGNGFPAARPQSQMKAIAAPVEQRIEQLCWLCPSRQGAHFVNRIQTSPQCESLGGVDHGMLGCSK